MPSDPTSGLPDTTHGCRGLQPFVALDPALECQDSNVSVPGTQACVSGEPTIEFRPSRTTYGPQPAPALECPGTPTPHATGCSPLNSFYPAIAGPTRAYFPLSLALRHRGCAVRAVASGRLRGPPRIVWAGRAGGLGMRPGRMYRRPGGRRGMVGQGMTGPRRSDR